MERPQLASHVEFKQIDSSVVAQFESRAVPDGAWNRAPHPWFGRDTAKWQNRRCEKGSL
jgi:hypothetical protein